MAKKRSSSGSPLQRALAGSKSVVQIATALQEEGLNTEDALRLAQQLADKEAEIYTQRDRAKRDLKLITENIDRLGTNAAEYAEGKAPLRRLRLLQEQHSDIYRSTDDPSLRRRADAILRQAQAGREEVERQRQHEKLRSKRMMRLSEAKKSRVRSLGLPESAVPEEVLQLRGATGRSRLAESIKQATKSQKLGRLKTAGVAGGAAAIALPILAKMIFGGSKEDTINPEMQMMLAQQIGQARGQDGGIGSLETSRTLNNVSKLLGILKILQEQAAQQPVQPALV